MRTCTWVHEKLDREKLDREKLDREKLDREKLDRENPPLLRGGGGVAGKR